MSRLRPFWRYYGGKWRAAPRYPKPTHPVVVEPFAGAAGYAMAHHRCNVVLVEKYPVVAGIWRFLIAARAAEILRIPEVEAVADLPSWVPQEARWLVGFCLNAAVVSPCNVLSAGRRRLRAMGRRYEGWNAAHRNSVACGVEEIKHWRIIEGDYTLAPDLQATWFVDPPYNNRQGSYYPHGPSGLDYADLEAWVRARRGQVMVCENEGATWLPFRPFGTFKAGVNGKGSREVIWP